MPTDNKATVSQLEIAFMSFTHTVCIALKQVYVAIKWFPKFDTVLREAIGNF